MALFSWSNEYRVGVPRVDEQHKRLFELAGDLHTAMSAGRGREFLGTTLSALIAYTQEHFGSEEKLMLAHGYPGYHAHKNEHDLLSRRVIEYQRQFESGKVAVTVAMLQFPRDWLVHHIGQTDKRMAAFLAGTRAA